MGDMLFGGADWLPSDSDEAEAAAAVLSNILPRRAPAPSAAAGMPAASPDYLRFVAQVPSKSSQPSAGPVPAVPARPSRAYRNNNPLDLETGLGQTGRDPRFAIFATPLDGLTAGSAHLLDYWKNGTRSLTDIVSKRSPPQENDTAAIIGRVKKKLGLQDEKAELDLHDPSVHIPLMKALMLEEAPDTGALYKPDDYLSALQAALRMRDLATGPSAQEPAVTAPPPNSETGRSGAPDGTPSADSP